MALMPEFEPRPHWCEASAALTTAPSLDTHNYWCGLDIVSGCKQLTLHLYSGHPEFPFDWHLVRILEQVEKKFAPESKMLAIKMD